MGLDDTTMKSASCPTSNPTWFNPEVLRPRLLYPVKTVSVVRFLVRRPLVAVDQFVKPSTVGHTGQSVPSTIGNSAASNAGKSQALSIRPSPQ